MRERDERSVPPLAPKRLEIGFASFCFSPPQLCGSPAFRAASPTGSPPVTGSSVERLCRCRTTTDSVISQKKRRAERDGEMDREEMGAQSVGVGDEVPET